jgi:hypothetical protein
MALRAQFKVFRSEWSSWATLFQEAADFASGLGPERVINVSHMTEGMFGLVIVWYWSDEPPPLEKPV